MLYGVLGQLEYLMDTMQCIGHQSHEALNLDDPGHVFHPRLLTIVDGGAFGSMQHLQQYDRMKVGDWDPFKTQTQSQHVPYERPIGHVPRQVRASTSGVRRHKHGLHDEDENEAEHRGPEVDPQNCTRPTGTHFSTSLHTLISTLPQFTQLPHFPVYGTQFTPFPHVPTFGSPLTPSPVPAFGSPFTPLPHIPIFGYDATTSGGSLRADLSQIYDLIGATGGGSTTVDLKDYCTLGQTMFMPTQTLLVRLLVPYVQTLAKYMI
ncbi:uncharacterized protein [Coffea arabica]|uniref:Uncharacterized protein n=1 Tax=Coffea arabica TaxID=13443 RepID=A0ABM4UZ32_COFAR